jgi:lipoyl-dependent peroxiredoxin subunit D
MSELELLRPKIPESAKDIRLNLANVLEGSTLSDAQRWGVAVASAAAARNPQLYRAVLEDARTAIEKATLGEGVVDDALAAAALMAMNNVYYRFRHMVDKAAYTDRPARLRMTRLARPATNKIDFELFCLAVSAINGCETCVRAHEKVALDGGLTEDQVHDAIRVAAVINAAAVALELDALAPVGETGQKN